MRLGALALIIFSTSQKAVPVNFIKVEFLRINQVKMSLIKLANPYGLANLSLLEADVPGLCGKILFLCVPLSSNKTFSYCVML